MSDIVKSNNSNEALVRYSDYVEAFKAFEEIFEYVREKRKKVMKEDTPKEYVAKKPIGGKLVDYVPYSYVDNKFKELYPLYEISLESKPELVMLAPGEWFILVAVKVKDRQTGNTEVGISMHRIQLKKSAKEQGIIEFVDPGNDAKAALSEAIKNAQVRFGIAADVYQRREIERTEDERKRFYELLEKVRNKDVREQLLGLWKNPELEVDEFLESLEQFVNSDKNR